MIVDKEEWMKAAACRGIAFDREPGEEDPFFPPEVRPGRSKKRAFVSTGKEKYCSVCPVSEECLDYALKNHIEWGVWGGVQLHDRKLINRDNRASFDALVEELEPSLRKVLADLEDQMSSL